MRPYPRVPLKFFEQRQPVDGGNVAHRLASWKIVGTSSLCLFIWVGPFHQIRDLAAHERKQFRVRALGRRKGLRERADQVAHGRIHRAIFFSSGDLERRF